MVPSVRDGVIRGAILTGVVCLVVSLALAYFIGGSELGIAKLGWPVILAAGIAAFTGFSLFGKIKKGILRTLEQDPAFIAIDRAAYPDADWQSVDDYAAQLEARGFRKLGEFTPHPQDPYVRGIVACFSDATGSTLVELQDVRVHGVDPKLAGIATGSQGMFFSAVSLVGGRMLVMTGNRAPMAGVYLTRGTCEIVGQLPGSSLLAVLDKHAQLVEEAKQLTGWQPTEGLTLPRYVILLRERIAQAYQRLRNLSGYELARQLDQLQADPKTGWSTPAAELAGIEQRTAEQIDESPAASGPPLVLKAQATGEDSVPPEPPEVAIARNAEQEQLRARMESGASWFYWIAGLSAVNAVVALMGSNWGFAIGLGISQVLSAIAAELQKDASASLLGVALLWVFAFAAIGFIAACGYFARRPSIIAFWAGIVVFALDTLIFLAASDWIGVAFHFLALYFLWSGLAAARELKKMAAK